jgi:hypothetical protein
MDYGELLPIDVELSTFARRGRRQRVRRGGLSDVGRLLEQRENGRSLLPGGAEGLSLNSVANVSSQLALRQTSCQGSHVHEFNIGKTGERVENSPA